MGYIMKTRIFVKLFLSLILVGCATTQNYNNTLNTWQGANANDLMASSWGYPDSQLTLPNGNRLYCYKQNQIESTPIMPTAMPGIVEGGEVYQLWCDTCFEVNAKNIIVNVSGKGNDCVETQHNSYRYSGIPSTAH